MTNKAKSKKAEDKKQAEQNLKKKLNEAALEKELETLLKECEDTLLSMSLVEAKGGQLEDYAFHSPVFRFIWAKLEKLLGIEELRKKAKFYQKGMDL